MESDVVENCRQEMPAGFGGRFGSHDVRLGHHPNGTPAKRPVHEANFDFYRSSRLNPLRASFSRLPATRIKRNARLSLARA